MEADFGTVVEELKRNNAEEAKRDGYRLDQATSHSQKNTELLENIFDEVCEEFPNNSEEINATIAQQRFEDLCQ